MFIGHTVLPNKELEVRTDGLKWRSKGDDPFFKIRFGLFRKPYLVMHLASDVSLDPKIYIDRGRGYQEDDAVSPGFTKTLVVKINAAWIGIPCSIRFDPCSMEASFNFTVESFASSAAADSYIAGLNVEPDHQHINLNVPRIRLPLPHIRLRKNTLCERYVKRSYELASAIDAVPHDVQKPWLSIVVPVYNTPTRYLNELLDSFKSQDQSGVELILSDDGSTSTDTIRWLENYTHFQNIKVVKSEQNGGIANSTNRGLERSAGEYITFLDHDDLIAPHALKLIRKAIIENPECVFLYTDEVIVNDKLRPMGAMLKPAFDNVLLTGLNYINHFSIFKRERLKEVGFLREGFDGSQDYDLLLRYLEGQDPRKILHLPYPAYLWRRTGATYSRLYLEKATRNAREAISDYFHRHGGTVEITSAITPTLHRPLLDIDRPEWPKITVIIPNKDSFLLISRIVGDLYSKTDYPNFEIIVVDNGTQDVDTVEFYEKTAASQSNFHYEILNESFNFSRSINRGLRLATGEHYLLLNNDVEVLHPDWLKELVSCLNFQGTGIVGAKLLFPSGLIQHAGVIVGFGGLAGHLYLNKPQDFGGPMNRLHVRNSLTCVTGAVMLISGECLKAVGQWDEKHFAVAYNDVDYCLRAQKEGFGIIWTPFACLRHHESLSRGAEIGPEKKQRFETEKSHLRTIHGTDRYNDPAHNPNYSTDRSTPRIVVPTRLHPPRTGLGTSL